MSTAAVKMKPFHIITQDQMRLGALCLAVVIYALWGQPTPPHFGTAEGMIAALLILAIWPQGVIAAVYPSQGQYWPSAGRILLFYGMSVPLIVALINGHDTGAVLRDVIAFFFLLLPLFCSAYLKSVETGSFGSTFLKSVETGSFGSTFLKSVETGVNRHSVLLAATVFIGVVFSLRIFFDALVSGVGLLNFMNFIDPMRLANAPTVLFTAFFAVSMCALSIMRMNLNNAPRGFLKILFLAVIAGLSIAVMAAAEQRATLAYLVLMMVSLALIGFIRRPYKTFKPVIVFMIVGVFFWPFISDVYDTLAQKNITVGGNMRAQEWAAVIEAVSFSPMTILFGNGWGAQFSSPAVGGDIVGFTHSLLSGLLLKSGLTGLFTGAFYLCALTACLWRALYRAPVIAIPLAGAFFIPLFLYASHKSFDYGLILLLIVLWGDRALSLPFCDPYRKNKEVS